MEEDEDYVKVFTSEDFSDFDRCLEDEKLISKNKNSLLENEYNIDTQKIFYDFKKKSFTKLNYFKA